MLGSIYINVFTDTDVTRPPRSLPPKNKKPKKKLKPKPRKTP